MLYLLICVVIIYKYNYFGISDSINATHTQGLPKTKEQNEKILPKDLK